MSNVVIMVWLKHLDAGFGDLLRGTIYLHKLSQQMKFKLIVDAQFHPVSQFLVSHPHEYSNHVVQNESKIINAINADDQFIIDRIRTHQRGRNPGPILMTTNHSDHFNALSDECKDFMRSLLIPNDEFKTALNDMLNAFKMPKNYSIIHFRLGDDDLINHASNLEYYDDLFKIVNATIQTTPNAFIMTDSVQFKQYLKCALHPMFRNRIIPTTPIHLSHPNADIKTIKETLFDFMILTNARVIKTHSKYGWISGFVKWVSHIFNVPLINLKPRPQFQQIKMNFSGSNSKINAPATNSATPQQRVHL